MNGQEELLTGGGRDFRQKIKGLKSLDLLSFERLRDSRVEILCWQLDIQVRSSEDSSHQHIDSTRSHGNDDKQKPALGCICEVKIYQTS